MPEELRRYYLDIMDIQVWDDLDAYAVVPTSDVQATVTITETVTPSPEKQEPVTTAQVTGDQSQAVNNNTVDDLESDWAELQTIVEQCHSCDLLTTRTQAVFGAGNHNADLLVVGEAPGQDEDMQGKPFVGEAGELLTAMLKAIGLSREEVYIVNTIKCKTPDNRDPLPNEIENCHAYLRRQIVLLQPKVIYAVGRVAAQALLNSKESISKLREQQHDFEGTPLIASFHPTYLLRKPSEKRKAWHDLQQIKSLLAK